MKLINEVQFVKLTEQKYLLLNLINAAADIVSSDVYNLIISGRFEQLSKEIVGSLRERRYIFDNDSEYLAFLSDLESRIDQQERSAPPSFLLIPTYKCNLRCVYCYEQTYEIPAAHALQPLPLLESQLRKMDQIVHDYACSRSSFNPGEITVTLMGGEPLLAGNLELICGLLKQLRSRNFTVRVVTNGANLNLFIEVLKQHQVQSIQVTLDGSPSFHDRRRLFHDGRGTFRLILENVKLAVGAGLNVYLRVNVDKSNLDDLPELARIIKQEIDSDYLHPYIYLLQDGGCSGEANVLNEQAGIDRIYEMEAAFPEVSIFDKKFHPAEFIDSIFNNTMYQPVLRHCGAAKNQHILDCRGNIYRCWHGIGNDAFRVGTFIPEDCLDEVANRKWKERSAGLIEECRKCRYRFICGTGCPAATHKPGDSMDITRHNCVEYQALIDTIVKKRIELNNAAHGR